MGDRLTYRGSTPGDGNLSPFITNRPGQLSLAILQWLGTMSIGQRTVMLCGWE